MKRATYVVMLISLCILLTPQIIFADRDCSTLLKGECVGCHEKEMYCENVGEDQRFWKGTLRLMESNGADLTKVETANLVECLSRPSELVGGICK